MKLTCYNVNTKFSANLNFFLAFAFIIIIMICSLSWLKYLQNAIERRMQVGPGPIPLTASGHDTSLN